MLHSHHAEREAFDAAAAKLGYDLRPMSDLREDLGDEFISPATAGAWAIWQAARSQQPATAVPAKQNRPEMRERQGGDAESQGVFRKFVVTRTDGSDRKGGKHHGCEYFVLDVDHDPYAAPALAAYADACEGTHRLLAMDMRLRYRLEAAPADDPAAVQTPAQEKS